MAPQLPSPFISEPETNESWPRGFDPDAFLAAIEQGAEEMPLFLASPSAAFLDLLMEKAA